MRVTCSQIKETSSGKSILKIAVEDTGIGISKEYVNTYLKVLPKPVQILPENMAAQVLD